MPEKKLKFRIQRESLGEKSWSFGAFLSYDNGELYLLFNVAKLQIAIGFMNH